MENEQGKDLKKLMSEKVSELGKIKLDEQVKAKIQEIENQFLRLIPKLAKEFDNEIPFREIKDRTTLDYELISDILLNLIVQKKIIGFISDQGTEGLNDDKLIIRDRHFVDTLEIDYETG